MGSILPLKAYKQAKEKWTAFCASHGKKVVVPSCVPPPNSHPDFTWNQSTCMCAPSRACLVACPHDMLPSHMDHPPRGLLRDGVWTTTRSSKHRPAVPVCVDYPPRKGVAWESTPLAFEIPPTAWITVVRHPGPNETHNLGCGGG